MSSRDGPNWLDMGNEFEECQSVSKLFKDIKDRTVTFDTEIAPDDRLEPRGHAFRRINHARWQLQQ